MKKDNILYFYKSKNNNNDTRNTLISTYCLYSMLPPAPRARISIHEVKGGMYNDDTQSRPISTTREPIMERN